MRTDILLNFDWKYQSDFKKDYLSPSFDDTGFATVDVPHTNIELPYNDFNEQSYQFVSCYRKTFTIEDLHQGKRILLHFEGVMAEATVYVNQQKITEHKGGYTPFTCDITDAVIFGGDNLLVVQVDAKEKADIPPFGNVVDYLTYGGIYREVRMSIVDTVYLENIQVKTPDVLSSQKKLAVTLHLDHLAIPDQPLDVTLALFDKGQELVSFSHTVELKENVTAYPLEDPLTVPIQLWSLDEPNLYTLEVSLFLGKTPQDTRQVRIGFREARFAPDGFYLNGKRIKLIGLNRHQSYPYMGYAMPKQAQYEDAELLKAYGVQMVRTSHYPQSRHFLDRCDELGLLVFEEIPGWQHIGDKAWQAIEINAVEAMIRRDWNHPSIVLWGVRVNESQDDDEFYKETNRKAHILDDTRQTGGVRNFENSHLLEDVFTYNDFIHRGTNEALKVPKKFRKKNVPYLVTEFNGHMFPTKKFDNESRRVEHALRHARVLDKMMSTENISGAVGWCLFDYNTHKEFGSGDRICYHGVMDMFRIPKDAAFVYQSQQSDRPVLHVASEMNIGEYEAAEMKGIHIFTNCDYVKLYKNGEYVSAFYPDKKTYPGLKHPPIVVDDFIGELIEKHENYNPKDAKRIKDVLVAVTQYGDKSLPLKYKLKMAWLMLKRTVSYADAVDLFNRYIVNWGSKTLEYEFVGYLDDKPVTSVVKGPFNSATLIAECNHTDLVEKETYDVSRIVVKLVDDHNNDLHYANDVLELKTTGPIDLIGPSSIALVGGSVAFWVRTKGKSGSGKVSIRSQMYKEIVLSLNVTKVDSLEKH